MDEKFRLVFCDVEKTPLAHAYLSANATAFDRLRDAVKVAGEMNLVWGVPFIAHKFTVLDPVLIDLLYRELVTPTSCGPRPGSPC